MILKKIKKHVKLSLFKLNEKKEIEKFNEYNHPILAAIKNSFLRTKYKNDFSPSSIASFEKCENYRKKLLNDKTIITYEIFNSDDKKIVSDICQKAASPVKWCRFFHDIILHTNTNNVLEIGTNLGISGTYILEALKTKEDFNFVTMEGLPQLCKIASSEFSTITNSNNFKVLQGLYDNTFDQALSQPFNYNFLFIDGNHQKEPTLHYFEQLKNKISHPAILIFDDINWSEGMQETWEIIKKDKSVNYSIDLYKLGIIIIDKNDTIKGVEFNLSLSN